MCTELSPDLTLRTPLKMELRTPPFTGGETEVPSGKGRGQCHITKSGTARI